MRGELVTCDLVKTYGRRRALDGFTLHVRGCSTLGLVGENGCGKTTWMMTVAGLVRPDSGCVDLCGEGPFDPGVHVGRLGLVPQDSEPAPEARPGDLLVRLGVTQGMSRADARRQTRELLAAFNLLDRIDTPFRALSHGMRKRIMTAQAFLGSPEVVLLDEPFGGLDPVECERLRRFILERRGRQTIVLASHSLTDIERLCTDVAFVSHGRVAEVHPLASLLAEGRTLEQIYLAGQRL